MLKIRLQRVGRVHEPSFRLVLTDAKNSTKSGRVKEVLGSYDPRKQTDLLRTERIKHWLSRGVNFTPSVNNLLIKHGVIRGKKIDVSSVSKKTQGETPTEGGSPSIPKAEEVSPTSDTIEEKTEEKAEDKAAV